MSSKNHNNLFSKDYITSRERFLRISEKEGAVINRYYSSFESQRGGGNHLSIDTAYIGNSNAKNILIIISGTHGIEGFSGAACQLAILKNIPHMSNTAILLVHALNPYGFNNLRRVNEDNIDLNRNFIDDDFTALRNPDFKHYSEIMFPDQLNTITTLKCNLRLISGIILGHKKRIQSAITLGQYEDNKNLFYGGKKPSWSNEVLREIVSNLGDKEIYLLDVHTGLGKYGKGHLLSRVNSENEHFRSMKKFFERNGINDVYSTIDNNSISANLDGTVSLSIPKLQNSITLEFGTLSGLKVLNALRAENYLFWNEFNSPAHNHAKEILNNCFTPKSESWRNTVITQFLLYTETYLSMIDKLSDVP